MANELKYLVRGKARDNPSPINQPSVSRDKPKCEVVITKHPTPSFNKCTFNTVRGSTGNFLSPLQLICCRIMANRARMDLD